MDDMQTKTPQTTGAESTQIPQKKASPRAPFALTLLLACLAGWGCLILNVAWTVWAVLRCPADSSLIGVIFQGSCSKTNRLSMWLHLLINILSTVLLAASNYCMQVSLAPTRDEVDAAHRQHKALAIGAPSLRNLGRTSSLRTFVWVLLVLSSLPLHLVFNSAIFSSISVSEYAFAVVDETFLTDRALWNVNASRTLSKFARAPFNATTLKQWNRLTPDECLSAYGTEFVTHRRNVLVVVDPDDRVVDANYAGEDMDNPRFPVPDPMGEHRLEGGYRAFTSGVNAYLAAKHYDWLCFGTVAPAAISKPKTRPGVQVLPASTEASAVYICSPKLLRERQDKWRVVNLPYDYAVRYCLSEPTEESCRLEYSPVILGIICAANLIKAVIMTTLFLTHRRFSSLLTIGDAVTSFLTVADATTANRCTWTKHDFSSPSKWSQPPTPRKLDAKPRRYGAVPSRMRWFLTLAAAVAAIGTLLGVLGQGIQADAREASVKIGDLWDRGFGTINTISLIGKGRGGNESWRRSTLAMVVLANTPQLLLSIFYFSYNALFTSMCAGNEWSNFGKRTPAANRKTLRVSKPREEQRGSYYLQLPLRISIPLIVLSIILHWLTSQSLFLAKVSGTDSHGGDPQNFVTTCGYSNIAIIFAIVVGALAVIILLGTAALPLASNMPIVGSSSAAISAACHPLRADVDPYKDKIGWGVEPIIEGASSGDSGDDQQPSHCTLTGGDTRAPLEGEVYT